MTLRDYLNKTKRLIVICAALAFIFHIASKAQQKIDIYNKKLATGGDIEVGDWEKIPVDVSDKLSADGAAISRTAETSIAARYRNMNTNISLKAVDSKYPLYGTLQLHKGDFPETFFARPNERLYGAAVDKRLLKELGMKMGDAFLVNGSYFQITAYIINEPDAAVGAMGELPRAITNIAGLSAVVNLDSTNDLRTIFRCRSRLPVLKSPESLAESMSKQYPETTWNLRTWKDPRF